MEKQVLDRTRSSSSFHLNERWLTLQNRSSGKKRKRRLTGTQKLVVWFSLLPLALAAGNLTRAVMALRYATRLSHVPMTVSWTYLAAMGGFWAVVFVGCVGGVVGFRRWGRWLTLASATLYEVHVWVNHLLFDVSDYVRLVRLRDLALSLLLLAFVWGFLSWPSIRKVFGRVLS
jgi:hypothetical protein